MSRTKAQRNARHAKQALKGPPKHHGRQLGDWIPDLDLIHGAPQPADPKRAAL